ncbi:MAG: hypothetical protein D6727_09020, partial [Gammaproteobacteria bacterium]
MAAEASAGAAPAPAAAGEPLLQGLTTAEARARQQQFGLNRIEAREKSRWQRLAARFWG